MKIVFISTIAFILSTFALLAQYTYTISEPSWVYIGEAKRLINDGENGKAMNILQSVIKIEKNNADAHYTLANIYYTEADNKTDMGSLASYKLAVYHYNKTIANAQEITVPANEIDAYFKLLSIYDITLNEEKFLETEKDIQNLVANNSDIKTKGRIYFRLGSHYNNYANYNKAIDNYKLAYDNKYRQKIALFRISLIYRKKRDYVKEKQTLLLADGYNFDYQEPSNVEVEYSIKKRLEQLDNVLIPQKFY